MPDILHIVVVLQHLQQLLHLLQRFFVRGDHGILRDHLHLGAQEGQSLRFQLLTHGGELIGIGGDLESVVHGLHVLGARIQHGHHHFVLIGIRSALDHQNALLVEHEAHAARYAQRAAIFRKAVTHIAGGTVAAVGNGFHDHGHTAGGIALVGDFFVIDIAQFTRGLFDGTLDIIVGHIVAFGLGDHIAQLGVAVRVAAAFAHRDGDFTPDLGKNLTAKGVRLAFLDFNVSPFAVSGHRISLSLSNQGRERARKGATPPLCRMRLTIIAHSGPAVK